MSKKSTAVQKWREITKKRIVSAFGGYCGICGYDKCLAALELHHLVSSEKEFSISSALASPKSWPTLVSELEKCVCVCSNCHKEIHAGLTPDIRNCPKFDPAFREYKELPKSFTNSCPICGKLKPVANHYCSSACAAKASRKVNWDNIDLKSLMSTGESFVAIGERLGISDSAVRKRAIKLGIYQPRRKYKTREKS